MSDTPVDLEADGNDGYDGFDADVKKNNAQKEMVDVRNLSHRLFFQCLFIFAIIGITLVVIISKNPYEYASPVASNIIGYAGAAAYLLLLFALLTCARDASTRVVLIVAVTMFLGMSTGFLFALNVSVQTRAAVPP